MSAKTLSDVRLTFVVPTRNRSQLAMASVRSLLNAAVPRMTIVVSDNSTLPEEAGRLALWCQDLGAANLHYVRPPQPLAMTPHWEWALRLARGLGGATHFSFLTDRMVFRPGALERIVELAGWFPDRVITYNHDLVDDIARPVRLHEFRWTGRLLAIDSSYLLDRAAAADHPPANPRFLNSVVPASVLEGVDARYGSVFDSISPDFCFAYRCLDIVDEILYWDRSALIHYARDRSNGAATERGILSPDSRAFQHELGGVAMNHATPVPEFRTITNAVLNEYCVVRSQSHSSKLPPIDMREYLRAMARDIGSIEDPSLAAQQTDLLLSHGGTLPPGGMRRYPQRVIGWLRDPLRVVLRAGVRVIANPVTQRAWGRIGAAGLQPPSSKLFTFETAEQAIAWSFRFPRRPTRSLRRLDWLRDAAHVRVVEVPAPAGGPHLLEVARL